MAWGALRWLVPTAWMLATAHADCSSTTRAGLKECRDRMVTSARVAPFRPLRIMRPSCVCVFPVGAHALQTATAHKGTRLSQSLAVCLQIVAAFGSPVLPTKAAPDYVEDWSDWEMHGLPGPGRGTGVGNVSWKMGLQKLVWTIDGGMLSLNSTVWYSRNTSGDAPSNSPPISQPGDSPHCPGEHVTPAAAPGEWKAPRVRRPPPRWRGRLGGGSRSRVYCRSGRQAGSLRGG